MIIGYLLVAGGVVHLVAGWAVPVTILLGIGGLWLVAGIGCVASSRWSRVRPAPVSNPIARARDVQANRGALARSLTALICATAALAVGIGAIGFDEEADTWRRMPIISGGIMIGLWVLGMLGYWASSTQRTATLAATVVLVDVEQRVAGSGASDTIVRCTVDVYPEGQTQYRATFDTRVPVMALRSLEPGARFPALVAGPTHPDRVIVDWTAAVAQAVDGVVSAATGTPTSAVSDTETRLRELDSLKRSGLVSDDEYHQQRARILNSL